MTCDVFVRGGFVRSRATESSDDTTQVVADKHYDSIFSACSAFVLSVRTVIKRMTLKTFQDLNKGQVD